MVDRRFLVTCFGRWREFLRIHVNFVQLPEIKHCQTWKFQKTLNVAQLQLACKPPVTCRCSISDIICSCFLTQPTMNREIGHEGKKKTARRTDLRSDPWTGDTVTNIAYHSRINEHSLSDHLNRTVYRSVRDIQNGAFPPPAKLPSPEQPSMYPSLFCPSETERESLPPAWNLKSLTVRAVSCPWHVLSDRCVCGGGGGLPLSLCRWMRVGTPVRA